MKNKKYIIITAVLLLLTQVSIIPSIGADEKSIETENAEIEVDICIKGGFGVKAIITNNYDFCLNEVRVDLQVKGGIFGLINKTVFANISIPEGETRIVPLLLFGLGSITVRAWVALIDLGVSTVDIIKEGKQLLFFTRLH